MFPVYTSQFFRLCVTREFRYCGRMVYGIVSAARPTSRTTGLRPAVGRMFGAALLVLAGWSCAFAAEPLALGRPVDCEPGRTCVVQNYVDADPSRSARDHACGTLTYDGHDGTDFRLPTLAAQRAGVNVLAAADGTVLRTRDGMADVSIAAADARPVDDRECGNGIVIAHRDGWQTQYCHMAKGSVRVKPGQRVAAGQPIGRIGMSGRTEFPHLHFTVRLAGHVVDPFAYGAPEGTCGRGTALWPSRLRDALAYRPRFVLNAGFAADRVDNTAIEEAHVSVPARWAEAPALIAYVRAVGLKAGDVQHLRVVAPDGTAVADYAAPPLDRDKAQTLLFAGKKRPPSGWTPGTYRALYSVVRDGQEVLAHVFEQPF
jgi:hypothetical protein